MNINFEYIIIVIVVILLSMTLHEAMHAFVAYWLGDDTAKMSGRLTINPIKHLDPFLSIILPLALAISGGPVFGGAKPVPLNYNNLRWGDWGVALVALAGPITNFLLAFFVFGFWVLIGMPNASLVGQIFIVAISVNLGFCIFNMIPVPPLDGSRIMYALAPDFVRRGMEAAERFGILIIFGLLLIAGSAFSLFISNAIKFIIGLFGGVFGI